MRYIVVGGNPEVYTGVVTYTSIGIVGKADTLEEAKTIFNLKYDECGGLLVVIDMHTGEEISMLKTRQIQIVITLLLNELIRKYNYRNDYDAVSLEEIAQIIRFFNPEFDVETYMQSLEFYHEQKSR